MSEPTDNQTTPEELYEYIVECLRKSLEPPTRDTIRRARETLLNQIDESTADYVKVAQSRGVKFDSGLTLDVQFRYNRDLEVWEFVKLTQSGEIELPKPLKFVATKFLVDEKFWQNEDETD